VPLGMQNDYRHFRKTWHFLKKLNIRGAGDVAFMCTAKKKKMSNIVHNSAIPLPFMFKRKQLHPKTYTWRHITTLFKTTINENPNVYQVMGGLLIQWVLRNHKEMKYTVLWMTVDDTWRHTKWKMLATWLVDSVWGVATNGYRISFWSDEMF
jgi:hypothetical protein